MSLSFPAKLCPALGRKETPDLEFVCEIWSLFVNEGSSMRNIAHSCLGAHPQILLPIRAPSCPLCAIGACLHSDLVMSSDSSFPLIVEASWTFGLW